MSGSITDVSDVILLTGVNVKRNYADLPFPAKLSKEQRGELREKVLTGLNTRFGGIQLEKREVKDSENISLMSMVEDACFYDGDAEEDALRAALVGSTLLSVTINREDHLNFSAFIRDIDISRVPPILLPMEKAMQREKTYAFDPNWGYLTSSLKNTGNALTGVYLMSLTGLNRMDMIEEERETLRKRHMELKRLIGGDEEDCELFCLSSVRQLGKSAQDTLNELSKAAADLAFRERDAREEMIYDDTDDFADSVMRALGILMNARIMDYVEFLGLYADVRAGLATGFAEGSLKELDDIAYEVSPETIRRDHNDLSKRDEELLRADICRRRFSERLRTIRI